MPRYFDVGLVSTILGGTALGTGTAMTLLSYTGFDAHPSGSDTAGLRTPVFIVAGIGVARLAVGRCERARHYRFILGR